MKDIRYYLRFLWVKSMRLGAYTGCHQLPERSFFFRDYQFPVCARCCGVLLGELLACIVPKRNDKKRVVISIVCLLAMFMDWFIQYLGIKESTNKRRLITGIGGGFGSWALYIMFWQKVKKILRPCAHK